MSDELAGEAPVTGPAAVYGLNARGEYAVVRQPPSFPPEAIEALQRLAAQQGDWRPLAEANSFAYRPVGGGIVVARKSPGERDSLNRRTVRIDAVFLVGGRHEAERLAHAPAWKQVPSEPGETITLTPADPVSRPAVEQPPPCQPGLTPRSKPTMSNYSPRGCTLLLMVITFVLGLILGGASTGGFTLWRPGDSAMHENAVVDENLGQEGDLYQTEERLNTLKAELGNLHDLHLQIEEFEKQLEAMSSHVDELKAAIQIIRSGEQSRGGGSGVENGRVLSP